MCRIVIAWKRFSYQSDRPSASHALFSPKVNLWAVARPGLEPLNAQWGASRIRQAPVGFEHALSVDLAELIGVKGGTSEEGGAKHIALHGNLLALATDHAVFLVHLSFDVKGEDFLFTQVRARKPSTTLGRYSCAFL